MVALKPWRPPFSSLLDPTSRRFYNLPKHQHHNQLSKHRNPWGEILHLNQIGRWATMRNLDPHFIIGTSATPETQLWMELVYFCPQCQLLRVGTGSAQRPPPPFLHGQSHQKGPGFQSSYLILLSPAHVVFFSMKTTNGFISVFCILSLVQVHDVFTLGQCDYWQFSSLNF